MTATGGLSFARRGTMLTFRPGWSDTYAPMGTAAVGADARDLPTQEQFFFDPARLKALAQSFHDTYATAQPFPHVVIDDFLPVHVAEGLLAEFPDAADIAWRHVFADSKQVKLACDDEAEVGPDRSLLALIIWQNRLRMVARKLVPPILADAAWLLRQTLGRERTRPARPPSGGEAPR